MGMYCFYMPRAATTSDAFNAVAEPSRRQILAFLIQQERPVGDIVIGLRIGQPSVSKHLRVLRQVGLVRSRRDGRRILYRTDAQAIRPLHEWTETFERFWTHQLNSIKERAEAKVATGTVKNPSGFTTNDDESH
jgi:DNA-binding transcriptional ArsR family regulator